MKKFINWVYKKRADLVKKQVNGEEIHPRDLFLGFTTHTPAIITHGSAGLNGSIKGVGFIPKEEFIEEILAVYMAHIETANEPEYAERGLKIIYEHLYADGCEEKIDFLSLGTLELAKAHTWTNLNENKIATLLFYEPPVTSFEVRCTAEIHINDIYHKFLNAQHDMFHRPNPSIWEERPAYIFRIKEIYDNSATKDGFGKLIYPHKNKD